MVMAIGGVPFRVGAVMRANGSGARVTVVDAAIAVVASAVDRTPWRATFLPFAGFNPTWHPPGPEAARQDAHNNDIRRGHAARWRGMTCL